MELSSFFQEVGITNTHLKSIFFQQLQVTNPNLKSKRRSAHSNAVASSFVRTYRKETLQCIKVHIHIGFDDGQCLSQTSTGKILTTDMEIYSADHLGH